ncbi:MAG: hypothetical protein WC780_06310 [Lentimicrobiaceae bacterium]|jgi:hypothetical protein
MKKALFFLILVVALSAINSNCKRESEDCHYFIKMQNNSNKAIYIRDYGSYPDTISFKYDPNPALDPSSYKLVASGVKEYGSKNDCIENKFKYYILSDTLMIFIFDAQTLETTPWDTVCKKYMVLKRYDLSLADLQRMNWTITYP